MKEKLHENTHSWDWNIISKAGLAKQSKFNSAVAEKEATSFWFMNSDMCKPTNYGYL